MTQLQQHELDELMLEEETSQQEAEHARLRASRDRGLVSEQYYQQYLYETGRIVQPPPKYPRLAELRFRRLQRENEPDEAVLLGLQPFRGCAQAKKRLPEGEGETPKPKRGRKVKVSACTPELGMKEARIKSGLSACIKHPNGNDKPFTIKQQFL